MKKSIFVMALLCLLFVFQSAFAQVDPDPYNRPQAIEGLVYNGEYLDLYEKGTSKDGEEAYTFYYRQSGTDDWGTADRVLQAKYPGYYSIEWIAVPEGEEPGSETVRFIEIEIAELEPPRGRRGLVYDPAKPNDKQYLIDWDHRGKAIAPDRYYYRLSEEDEWDTDLPEAINPGTYTVYYILWSEDTPDKEIVGFELKVTIAGPAVITPTVRPTFAPFPTMDPNQNYHPYQGGRLFYVGDGYELFDSNMNLPATGFPTRFHKPLAIQPEDLNYENLTMRLQIPTINVDVELTGIPEVGDSWAVDWLEDRAGLLSRSAMPGEGYAMIAGHNHLNTDEIGPFALLFSLQENDRIFVNTPDDGIQIYSVYANELLEPDDMQKMEAIAKSEGNSIILVTCENELVDGGYLNRRVVFAKPL